MAEYKKNHVVSQMILRKFTNSNGEFFYYNSKNPKRIVEVRKPENTFFRNDIYVSKDINEKRDVSLEVDIYGKLERKSSKVLTNILEEAGLGKVPNLKRDEVKTVQDLLLNQLRRVPEYQSELTKRKKATGVYDERKILKHEKKLLIKNNSIENQKKQRFDIFAKIIYNLGVGVVVLPVDSQYIIGSNPCVIKKDGNGCYNFTLPISPKIGIVLMGSKGDVLTVDGRLTVAKINKTISSQSTEIAGASKELVEKYAEEMKARAELQK